VCAKRSGRDRGWPPGLPHAADELAGEMRSKRSLRSRPAFAGSRAS
jgi:hypothetical protein